jgi:hypothetical protein
VSALYDKGREGFLDGSIDWDTDDIRVAMVSSGYTINLATHQFVSDLGANIVARSAAGLSSKTVAAGVADAADHTITVAASQPQVTKLIIYKYNASDAAARLIASIDTGTGLPFTPASSGGDTIITWDNGSNKIFKL